MWYQSTLHILKSLKAIVGITLKSTECDYPQQMKGDSASSNRF